MPQNYYLGAEIPCVKWLWRKNDARANRQQTMNQRTKKGLGDTIKVARVAKGYTQQQLSDLTGISLRSIQRIEKEAVLPRSYTLQILAAQLGIENTVGAEQPEHAAVMTENETLSIQHGLNKPRKIILSAGAGMMLFLGSLAFLFQAPAFPESAFEAMLFWMAIVAIYTIVLFKVWR